MHLTDWLQCLLTVIDIQYVVAQQTSKCYWKLMMASSSSGTLHSLEHNCRIMIFNNLKTSILIAAYKYTTY